MADIQPRIHIDEQGMKRVSNNGRNPFDDFFKQNTNNPKTWGAMKDLAVRMETALKEDLRKGHQSNNPRTRRNQKKQERGGAYFATQVKTSVPYPARKIPVFFITSTAKNSLAYEASHANMVRVLAMFANGGQ
jgi:hypothetical protein